LQDGELMAQGHVLEGDGRRPAEQGADEGPEPQHEYHQGTPASEMASAPRPYRMGGGGGGVKSSATSENEFLTRIGAESKRRFFMPGFSGVSAEPCASRGRPSGGVRVAWRQTEMGEADGLGPGRPLGE